MKVYYAKCKEGIEAPDGAYVMKEVILQRKPHILYMRREQKHCNDCNTWLPISKFYEDKTFWDRLHQHCKDCCNARAKGLYMYRNKERK